MKTEIHPDYVECQVHCSCGNEFTTRSTVSELRVELCSECHPFYTGKQKLVDTGGRVERFQRRAAKAKTQEGVADVRCARAEPRYMGGQAVLEGVMMRGASHVGGRRARSRRRRSRSTSTTCPAGPSGTATSRSCAASWGSASRSALGYRALTWSANQQMPEEEQISEKAMGWTVGGRRGRRSARSSSSCPRSRARLARPLGFHGSFPSSKASLRLAIFLGYLLADRRACSDIKRVFQYHGAEHKAIAAYENDVELTPETAQQFSHRARALRHELPAHGDGRRDRRVLGDPAAEPAVRHRVARRADPADRRARATRSSASSAKNMHRRWVRRADAARACCCSGSRPASPTSTSSRSRSRRCGR